MPSKQKAKRRYKVGICSRGICFVNNLYVFLNELGTLFGWLLLLIFSSKRLVSPTKMIIDSVVAYKNITIPIIFIMLPRFTFGLFFFSFPFFLTATHIAGGQFSYECLGSEGASNRYNINLDLFLDCSINNKNYIDFDNEIIIAIYSSNNLLIPYERHTVPLILEEDVEIEERCFDYTELGYEPCIRKGIYTLSVMLPRGAQSYYITYQRCCRTPASINIKNTDEIGGTYTLEIPQSAQVSCNNSSRLNTYPPLYVCIDQDINYKLNITDSDGDDLVFTFCSPLVGPKRTNAVPDPPKPPPYTKVTYNSPAYSPSQPMGGNPIVNMNPETGTIRGKPQSIGQYLIGVCVNEYRNNRLIGSTNLEFVIQVIDCRISRKIVTNSFITPACSTGELGAIDVEIQEKIPPNFSFEWSNGATSEDLTDLTPGDYSLTVTDNDNGCTNEKYYTIENLPPPRFEMIGDTTVNAEDEIELWINPLGDSHDYIVEWQSEVYMDDPFSFRPTVLFDNSSLVTATVAYKDNSLCTNTQQSKITLKFPSESSENNNGITPNGDGLNDVLFFSGLDDHPKNQLTIFNRWGDVIFHVQPYQNNWSGQNKNTKKPLPSGTYYYILRLDIPEGKYHSGSVTIIRK